MKKLTHREVQSEAFTILKFIKEVCEINSISYFLFYGTLLGAVRHKGFIPWDDDVDIVVPRKDYEKLKNCINKGLHDENFFFHDAQTSDDYPYLIGRICSNHTRVVRKDENYDDMGIFVDVYPIDDISDYYLLARCKSIFLGVLSSLYFASTRTLDEPYCKEKLIRKIFMRFSKVLGSARIKNLVIWLMGIGKLGSSCSYVGPAMWMTMNAKRNIFSREYFEKSVSVEFNGEMFAAPAGYLTLLKNYYGDFMKLPPVDQQTPHHEYDAYITEITKGD